MSDLLNAPFLKEMVRTVSDMYARGWDERNGGNVSLLLEEAEVAPYLDGQVLREIPTGFEAPELEGRYLLVTGTGKYFRNLQHRPEECLGLIRLKKQGRTAQLLWGFSDGGSFTSELPAHVLSHAARLAADPKHRVVLHCHPTNLLAMTYVHPLDEREFTRTLWRMGTECIAVFPEGLGVLEWMLCGTNEIGVATAEKMGRHRLVVWAQHGLYGAGNGLDQTFGLIETAEKAAEVYLKVAHLPIRNTITDQQLRIMADAWGYEPPAGWLD